MGTPHCMASTGMLQRGNAPMLPPRENQGCGAGPAGAAAQNEGCGDDAGAPWWRVADAWRGAAPTGTCMLPTEPRTARAWASLAVSCLHAGGGGGDWTGDWTGGGSVGPSAGCARIWTACLHARCSSLSSDGGHRWLACLHTNCSSLSLPSGIRSLEAGRSRSDIRGVTHTSSLAGGAGVAAAFNGPKCSPRSSVDWTAPWSSVLLASSVAMRAAIVEMVPSMPPVGSPPSADNLNCTISASRSTSCFSCSRCFSLKLTS
mmetsp:Transcript_109372/g.309398  ORF Transcript_109372/g.309398 Transcript_109372/m.309398 type:complete len:260 (-) Transcript_109372:281-1060(-)